MTTLIGLLGKSQLDSKSGYKTAKYKFEDGDSIESPYFGIALAKSIKVEKLVLVGTSGSMWDIFFDHQGGDDEALLSLVDAVQKQSVTREMLDVHREYLSRKLGMPVECLIIPHARNSSEQASILTELAKAVAVGEKVVLDVTHGFRHLPMLALVAARYLAHVRNVDIQDVYYGALEMTDSQSGETPVLNLGGMLKMLDWVEALAVYEDSGNYGVFAPLYEADGMPEKRTEMISKAVYFERSSNPAQARENLTGAFKSIKEHDGVLGRLFSPHLAENVSWFRETQRPEWELALADRYLQRKDYLRATIYLFESHISFATRKSGGNLGDYDDRNNIRLDCKNNDDFRALEKLRNALAHGVRSFDDKAKRLLQNEKELNKELRRLRGALFRDS